MGMKGEGREEFQDRSVGKGVWQDLLPILHIFLSSELCEELV